MAKGKHLSEDEIRYVVDVESSKAQQEIHKLEKSSGELRAENKRRLDQLIKLEAAGKKQSQQYKDLKKRYNEVGREIKQNAEQIAKLTNGINVNNLTMNQLKKQAKQLQKQLDDTSQSLHPEAYKQIADRLSLVNGRMEELKGTANSLKGTLESMKSGGIKGFLSGILNMGGVKGFIAGSGLLKVGGMVGTAVIEGAKQVFQKAKLFYEFNVEIEEARRLTREFLNVEGRELTEASSQISVIAKQTGKDYKEVLTATDTLMNQFGLTAKEAYETIKDGIQAGADENGTFFSQIQQYTPAFRDAGISVQELVALITQTRSGIFNEQGMSLIQTATNRIRTMSTATQKALDDIGISSQQLEQDLVSGDKSIIEAVQMIATKIRELPQNSREVGEVMKDVFGKTASNEGMKMIETLANISTNMDDLKGVTGEYGKLQREQIDTQAELNEKLSDMFGIGQGGFKEMTTKAEIFILKGLIKTIDYCKSLYDELASVRVIVETVKVAFDTCFKAIEFGFDLIIDVVKGVGRELKALANMVEGFFTLDFDQLKNGWNQLGRGFVKTAKEIASDGMDVGTRWGNNFVKGVNNVMGKSKVDSPDVDGGTLSEVTVTGKRKHFSPSSGGGKKGGGSSKDNADELAMKEYVAARKKDLEQAKRDYQEDVNALNLALAQKRLTQEQYNTMMVALKNTYADNVLAIENSYYERSLSISLKDSKKRAELQQQQEQNVYQAKQQQFNAQLEAEKQYQAMLQKVVAEGKFKQQLTLEEEKTAKLAVLEGYYQAALEYARQRGLDLNAIEDANAQARLNIEKEYTEKTVQQQLQARQKYGLLSDSERLAQELKTIKDDYDKKLLTQEEYNQAVAAKEKEYADKRKQQRIQLGVERQTEYQQQLEQLKAALDQQLITQQEYDERAKQLKMDSWKQQFDYYSQLFGGAMKALQDAELANVDAKYDAEIEAAKGNAEKVEELENKKANEKLKVQKKYADVNFAIQASQIIANTAVSIMKALSELGPIAGPIAAALMGVTGAAQLAAANAERQKVKKMTLSGSSGSSSVQGARVATGYEEGGHIDVEREQDGKKFHAKYDPNRRGYIDRPTVIVGEGPTGKSKEWVASNAALANPTVAPLIDIIDRAQRVGNISTLDMRKYLLQRQTRGLESGGSVSPSSTIGGTAIVPASLDLALVQRLYAVLEHIDTHGIPAYVALDEFDAEQKRREQSRKIGSKE